MCYLIYTRVALLWLLVLCLQKNLPLSVFLFVPNISSKGTSLHEALGYKDMDAHSRKERTHAGVIAEVSTSLYTGGRNSTNQSGRSA